MPSQPPSPSEIATAALDEMRKIGASAADHAAKARMLGSEACLRLLASGMSQTRLADLLETTQATISLVVNVSPRASRRVVRDAVRVAAIVGVVPAADLETVVANVIEGPMPSKQRGRSVI